MSRRARIWVAVLLLGGFTLALWLLPMGHGEYARSPNGRWRAHVTALSRGTLHGVRQRWVELRIERLPEGTTVWRQRIPYPSPDQAPDYGDRGARHVMWSTDSSQVTVWITNNTPVTIPLTSLPGTAPIP